MWWNGNTFKEFFSNLASDFVAKLPPSSNKYEVSSVRNYQNILGLLPSKFKFSNARRLWTKDIKRCEYR